MHSSEKFQCAVLLHRLVFMYRTLQGGEKTTAVYLIRLVVTLSERFSRNTITVSYVVLTRSVAVCVTARASDVNVVLLTKKCADSARICLLLTALIIIDMRFYRLLKMDISFFRSER